LIKIGLIVISSEIELVAAAVDGGFSHYV